MKILFVVNSDFLNLYFLECIKCISKKLPEYKIYVFKDEEFLNLDFSFLKTIYDIDKRFTNFLKDPLSKSLRNQILLENEGVIFIKEREHLEVYDWIIFENKKSNFLKFQNFTKNGYLTLFSSINAIKHNVFNNNNIELNILYYDSLYHNWFVCYNQSLNCEIGIINNLHKILFNYSLFLVKFLQLNTISLKQDLIVEELKSSTFDWKLTRYYFGLLYTILRRKIYSKQYNWKIAIKNNNIVNFIKQPDGSFWADPFIVEEGNQKIIFFEELNPEGKGVISCVILGNNNEILKKGIIIEKKYHMSFPNVFKKDGGYYMIPEMSAGNNLSLFKCVSFPFKWNFEKNLIKNIKLVDSVWIYHDNLYWIFANKIEEFESTNNEKLYLYYSDSLFSSEWNEHVQNPVICNIGSARNAGAIYKEDDKFYRVSQNCLKGYGGSIVINRILTLSKTNYEELKVDEILPSKDYQGMHTLNKSKKHEVFDFLCRE